MKKFIIIALAIVLFQEWGTINYYLNPPPNYADAHDGKAILYSASWCGFCKKTRALLNQNKIPFVEYDVEISQEGNQQYKRLGGNGVPLMLINGQVVRGYKPDKILALSKPSTYK